MSIDLCKHFISQTRQATRPTHARTTWRWQAGWLAGAGCRVRVGVDEQRLSVGKVEIRGLSVAGLVTRVMDENGAGGGGVHAGFKFKQRSNAVFKKYFGNWLPLYSFAILYMYIHKN